MASSMADAEWEIDEEYFNAISNSTFAEEIRAYPCLWDSSKADFRKSKTKEMPVLQLQRNLKQLTTKQK